MRSPRALHLGLVALVLVPTGVLAFLSLGAVDAYRTEAGTRMRGELDEMQATFHRIAREVAAEDATFGVTRTRLAAEHVAERLPFEAPRNAFDGAKRAFDGGGRLWTPDRLELRVVDASGATVIPATLHPGVPPPATSDRERLLEELRRRADVAQFGSGDLAAAERVWTEARERFTSDDLKAVADVEHAWLRVRADPNPERNFALIEVPRLSQTWPAQTLDAVGRTWALLSLRGAAGRDISGPLARLIREGTLDEIPLTAEERTRALEVSGPSRRVHREYGASDVRTAPLPAGLTLEVRRTLIFERSLVRHVEAEARKRWPAGRWQPLVQDLEAHFAVSQVPAEGRRKHELLLPGGANVTVLLVHTESQWLNHRIEMRRRWTIAGAAALFILVALGLHLTLKALRREREARRLKDDFLANVSHELRTPLTSVCLHADLLAEGPLPDAQRRAHAEVVRAEGARLSALVDDLLDFAARERGARRLEPAPVDVGRAVTRAVEPFRVLAEREGVHLVVEVGAGEVSALADPLALERILANLLGNAWKHGRPSRDGEPGRIRVTATSDDTGADVTVSDDGPGIPEVERGALFERFRRGAAAAKTRGVGLGLALSRDLARSMGGDLVVALDPLETVFRLTLPPVPPETSHGAGR